MAEPANQETPEQSAARVEAEAQAAAGSSPATTQAPAAAAAQAARPEISEEEAKRIARATIAELEQRGIFEEAAEPAPAPTPEPASQESGDTPPNASAEPDQAPKKRTLAARFMGIE